MPPKTPATGAKKKVVKTIRKTIPKPKTPTTTTSPPAETPTPPPTTPPTISTTTPDIDTASPPTTTPCSPKPTATTIASPEAPQPEPLLTPPPSQSAPLETPASLETTPEPSQPVDASPVATKTTPEPSQPDDASPMDTKTTPETSQPVDATPVASKTTPEPSQAVDASPVATKTTPKPSKPAGKLTTRIVKKIVKRVVVKRVPKASVAQKVDDKVDAAQNPKSDAAVEVGDVLGEKTKGDEGVGGDAAMSERRRRRKTEIFIGGLDRDAKEEDLRKVFGKVGEIVEVRMMMDSKTGKNKGYAFLRYAEAMQAKKAVEEFAKVEVCGKLCGAAALEGKDTIFLGNIDKKWKKDDIIKLLQENGIEKIDTLTLMPDSNNTEMNRGFAFLELETNRDAQLAYKKLQKKDAFGKDRNVKVSWAEPLNEPDEDEMQKVKSIYAVGIPSSWNEDKVREAFKKFGEIERVVLARNIHSAKRKDFAFVNYTTREAALSCIELFEKEELTDKGSKVTVKVSFAKPVQKDKQPKGGPKPSNKDKVKEKPVGVRSNVKAFDSSNRANPSKVVHTTNSGDTKSSTTRELLHVLREQAAWKPEQIGYVRGPAVQDYTHSLPGDKRPFSALDGPYSDLRGYPRPRMESSFPATTSSSYAGLPHGAAGSSLSYYQRYGAGYGTGAPDYSSSLQRRQGGPPYGSNFYY